MGGLCPLGVPPLLGGRRGAKRSSAVPARGYRCQRQCRDSGIATAVSRQCRRGGFSVPAAARRWRRWHLICQPGCSHVPPPSVTARCQRWHRRSQPLRCRRSCAARWGGGHKSPPPPTCPSVRPWVPHPPHGSVRPSVGVPIPRCGRPRPSVCLSVRPPRGSESAAVGPPGDAAPLRGLWVRPWLCGSVGPSVGRLWV